MAANLEPDASRSGRSAARRTPLLVLSLVLGTLGGCVTPTEPSGSLDPLASPHVDGADLLGSARTGTLVPIEAEGLPGIEQVVVGRQYAAASGRRCRAIADADGVALDRVVCEAEGRWRLVRSLDPSGETDRGRFGPAANPATLVVVPAEFPRD